MELDKEYWQSRYELNQTGWDAGRITAPIKAYIDQLSDKTIRILIPGAGNGYEADYLYKNGFTNVFVLDIAEAPLLNLARRIPEFPIDQLIHADFFEHQGQYDLIIEQTFYCAIDPKLRDDYVRHVHDLLKPGGKLVGLLWEDPMFNDHPPYGGNMTEYRDRFSELFDIETLEIAYNSIPPRAGREAWIKFKKK